MGLKHIKVKGKTLKVRVPEGATKEQLDEIVEDIVRTTPPEQFEVSPAVSTRQPLIPTKPTPPPVQPERRPVVTPPPTPKLTGVGPSFSEKVQRPEMPFAMPSVVAPAAATAAVQPRTLTPEVAEEIARFEQTQAEFDAALPGIRKKQEALRNEYNLESSPEAGIGAVSTDVVPPGINEEFGERLAGFMAGQQFPAFAGDFTYKGVNLRELASRVLGVPLSPPLPESILKTGASQIGAGLEALAGPGTTTVASPWAIGEIPGGDYSRLLMPPTSVDELRERLVGLGRIGFGGLTMASPVVAPPLAGAVAAGEVAREIDPEGPLSRLTEFAFSPIQTMARPETKEGQEWAELADLATWLIGGAMGSRKPKLPKPDAEGTTFAASVGDIPKGPRGRKIKVDEATRERDELAAWMKKQYGEPEAGVKPGPRDKVSAFDADGWERMNRGDFDSVTDITPDVFSYLKGRGGKPVLAGRDGEALIGKSGLTHQDMVNDMTPEQGKAIRQGGTVSGRVSDKKDRIILWGDKKKSQKLTNFLFDLVQKGALNKDATVHFADNPKTFKLKDVIGGEFTDFGSTILPIQDMSIPDMMQELKRLQNIPRLTAEEQSRKKEIQKRLTDEAVEGEEGAIGVVSGGGINPDILWHAGGGGKPFSYSRKKEMMVGNKGETHNDMMGKNGQDLREEGEISGRISDTGAKVSIWNDLKATDPRRIREALSDLMQEGDILPDAKLYVENKPVSIKEILSGEHENIFSADLTGGLTAKAMEAGKKILNDADARKLWAGFGEANERAKQLAAQRKTKEAHAEALRAQEIRETIEGYLEKRDGKEFGTKALRPQEIDKMLTPEPATMEDMVSGDGGYPIIYDVRRGRTHVGNDLEGHPELADRKKIYPLEDLESQGDVLTARVTPDGMNLLIFADGDRVNRQALADLVYGLNSEGLLNPEGRIKIGDGKPKPLKDELRGTGFGAELLPGVGKVAAEGIRDIADRYVKKRRLLTRIETEPRKVEVENARRIADEYDKLPKLDESPLAREAYRRLGEEVDAQFKELTRDIEVEWWTEDGTAAGKPKEGQPYKNSEEMVRDIRENKKLKVFTGGEDHPYLGRSTADAEAKGASLNDKLRAIHDAFGHAEKGLKFDSHGEENAWVEHSKMFTPLAQWALTSETRGQNSWVNYGKHMYNEKGERVQKGLMDRPFADQKAALLPYELTKTGVKEIDAAKDAFMESPEFKKLEKQAKGLEVARERLSDEAEFPEGYGEDVLNLYKSVEKELKKQGLQPMKKGDKRYTPEARVQRFVDVYEPAARDAAIKDQAEGGKMSRWYSSYRDHLETLTKNVDSDLAKPGSGDLYAAMESVFSNGNPVSSEVNIGIAEWAKFKKNGEFNTEVPRGEGGWGARGATMRPALDALNALLKKFGGDHAKVAEWLKTKHPIEEVRAIKPTVMLEGGKGEPVYGAMVLGPKVGAYALNKMGISDVVTLDSWMHRTWRAAMGQFSEMMGRTYDSGGNIQPQVQLNSAFILSERRMMTQGIKKLGEKLNLSPQEVQALLWGREREFAKRHGQTISESAPHAEFSRRRYEQKLAEGFGDEVRGTEEGGQGPGRSDLREGDVGDTGGDGTDFGLGASILPTGDLLSEKAFEKLKKHAAGSINVGRMKLSDKDREKAIKYAETIQKEIEKVTGEKVTVEEVLEAAKDVDGWKKLIPREEQVKVFAQINKLRQLVAQDIKKDRLHTKEAHDRFLQLNGIANYAGRLLRFFREDAGGIEWGTKQQLYTRLQKMGIKLRDIQKRGKKVDWENADEVAKFYREFVKPETKEVIDELRYISMLSSPRTHVVNAFSNLTQAGFTMPATRLAEAGTDWMRSLMTRKEREVFASEVPAYYRAAISSLPDAFSSASKAFLGESPIQHLDLKRMGAAGEAASGIMKPISKLNYATRYVTQALEAGDVFFRKIITEGERAALYERARKKGERLTDKVMERINQEAEDKGAYGVYRKALDPENKTLQGDLLSRIDEATQALYSAGKVPGVRWVVPFIQTPMNILKQGIEYSPMGFFTMKGAGKNRQLQFSKALVGSMVTAGTALMISDMETTWDVPTSPSEKADFYAQGKIPFAIKFGDTWVQINRLGTLSYPIAIAMMAKHGVRDGDVTTIPATMLEFFSEQSYMQGLKQIQEAVDEPDKHFQRFITNVGKQVIPLNSLQRWANGFLDRSQRVPDNFFERLAADLPGASKLVTERATPYGETAKKPGLAENLLGLSPLPASKENKNKIVQELERRKIRLGVPSRVLFEERLPQTTYQKYIKRVGELVMKDLEIYFPEFGKYTNEGLQELVDQISREVRRDVRDEMFGEEQDAYEAREDELEVQ